MEAVLEKLLPYPDRVDLIFDKHLGVLWESVILVTLLGALGHC